MAGDFCKCCWRRASRRSGKTITVLGAGGAARAVVLKLAQSGARRIFVCNRTRSKAEALAQEFPTQITPCGLDEETLQDCALFLTFW